MAQVDLTAGLQHTTLSQQVRLPSLYFLTPGGGNSSSELPELSLGAPINITTEKIIPMTTIHAGGFGEFDGLLNLLP